MNDKKRLNSYEDLPLVLDVADIQRIMGISRASAYELVHKPGFPADRLEKIQAAFSDFKKEALQRKKAVKTGTASPKEFTDWLYQQSNVIVELTDY